MKYAELIGKMTLNEKAEFCSGSDFWNLAANERLGIPSIMVTDGPHGMRKKKDKKEKGELLSSVPAVCYPTAATTSASWDPELLYEMGSALGDECLKEKVSVLLGPGINIKRSPLCGRNFEYFSEDPFLAGELAAAFINGVQDKGVGTSLKHFAANNQETRRMTVDAIIDERALREIYLAGFEKAVKQSKPWTIMNAYNRLNGHYCSENRWLLTDVLRNEWGFEGVVVTDWGAENDRVLGLLAGQELEMPSSYGLGNKKIIDAVQNGELDESILDESVDRLLQLIFRASENMRSVDFDFEKSHQLARKIATQSMVLLKNEDNMLPLANNSRIAVVGEMARSPRYQGAGSSLINPVKLENAFDAFLDSGIGIIYSAGYNKNSDLPDANLISSAVNDVKNAEVVIVFVGLTDDYEAEGYDRTHIDLPESHNALIDALANVNKNIVVVLSGGSPVRMPWLPKVKAVLNGYLGGQAGGSAIVDLLLGKVNPSGKLAETYPLSLSDVPSTSCFPGSPVTVEYRESIYVGYRYFDKAEKQVEFPFGFGLSYTSFEYSGLKLSKKKIKDTDTLTVTFNVKNVGDREGAEIAQVYISDVDSTVFRPKKELKGFKKVFLLPNEQKTVEIILDKRSFAYYNVAMHDWHVESGEFKVLVGSSSRDIKLDATVNVESTQKDALVPDYKATAKCYYTADVLDVSDNEFENLLGREIPQSQRDPNAPITINSTLEDAKDTPTGKAIIKVIEGVLRSISKGGSNENMMKAMALQIPIRSFVSMSAGVFSQDMADGLISILNGGNVPKGVGKIIMGLVNAVKNIKGLLNAI